jgi:hypothetical protein
MKLIVGISAIAVLGAALIYNVQNNENAESEKIAKVTDATPVERVSEQAAPFGGIEDEQDLSMASSAELAEVSDVITNNAKTNKIVSNKTVLNKAARKQIEKKKVQVKAVAKNKPTEEKNEVVSDDVVSLKQAAINKTALNLDPMLSSQPGKKFTGYLSLLGTTDFKETADSQKNYAGKTSFSIGYQINDTYKLSLSSSISKDLSSSYEENVNNTSVTLRSSSVDIVGDFKLYPSLTGTYPTSKASKVRDEMNGAVTIRPTLVKQLTSSLSFSYVPGVSLYSHKYKTTRVNTTNTQYVFSQTGGLDYLFTDSFSIGTSLSIVQSWSYFGTQKDNQFSTDISLGYAFLKSMRLTTGIATGGLLYDAEKGPDSNIEIYDPNTTAFYIVYGIAL